MAVNYFIIYIFFIYHVTVTISWTFVDINDKVTCVNGIVGVTLNTTLITFTFYTQCFTTFDTHTLTTHLNIITIILQQKQHVKFYGTLYFLVIVTSLCLEPVKLVKVPITKKLCEGKC